MRADEAASLQAEQAGNGEKEEWGEEGGGERKEQNQTVRLSAVISSIWLGVSSCRANSGLAR